MNLMGQPAYVGRHCGSNEYDVTRKVVDFYADTANANVEVIEDQGDYEINYTDALAEAKS